MSRFSKITWLVPPAKLFTFTLWFFDNPFSCTWFSKQSPVTTTFGLCFTALNASIFTSSFLKSFKDLINSHLVCVADFSLAFLQFSLQRWYPLLQNVFHQSRCASICILKARIRFVTDNRIFHSTQLTCLLELSETFNFR